MKQYLDSKTLGLHPRTIVEQIGRHAIAIVLKRKSRIIMADGEKILAKAEKIKKAKPDVRVMLKTSAPVCSKTVQYLADNGIELTPD
jgi:hypothetical protein